MPGEKTPGKPTMRRYSKQEKQQAVRLVRQLRAELGARNRCQYAVPSSRCGIGGGATTMTAQLEVFTEGDGPRVVLVHGSVMSGEFAWEAQTPLAERWTLVKPNRRGYGNSPPALGEDFEVDADDIAALLEDGDHLVGQSYGGVVALLAAAKRPDAVASLAVFEPPAMGVARTDDIVREAIAEFDEMHERFGDDIDAWARAFAAWVRRPGPLPDPLPTLVRRGAALAYNQRRPQDAVIPLGDLRDASFPILVVRGDGHPMLGRICEVLVRSLSAEDAYVGGVGHMIPSAGAPLNDLLEAFWSKATHSTP